MSQCSTHADHPALEPRDNERETTARLDALLLAMEHAATDGDIPATESVLRQLLANHIAELAAGLALLERAPQPPLHSTEPVAILRWLTVSLRSSLLSVLAQFLRHETQCTECLRLWTVHVLDAKTLLDM